MAAFNFPQQQLEGLRDITTDFGIWQHVKDGKSDVVNGAYPFSSDDQARLLQVWCRYSDKFEDEWFIRKLPRILMEYAEVSTRTDGLLNNYRKKTGGFVESPEGELYDVFGRWMFALAEASFSKDTEISKRAKKIYEGRLDVIKEKIIQKSGPHALAYSALATSETAKRREVNPLTLEIMSINRGITNKLQEFYDVHSAKDWLWPDEIITYCGSRIPQALLSSFQAIGGKPNLLLGLQSLDFYTKVCFEKGIYWPIGNGNGDGKWYPKNGKKAKYCQQTIEGIATVPYNLAYQITQKREYETLRDKVLSWFFGKNSAHQSLVADRGVCDGITKDGINSNQGAESRLAFLLAMSTINF